MKKVTVNIPYDEEKLNALKLYLEQKGVRTEDELTKALDTLYAKTVPAGVRTFIELRSGTSSDSLVKPPRKPKPSFSSVLGGAVKETDAVESPES